VVTSFTLRLWSAALVSAAVAWACKLALSGSHTVINGLVILVAYGVSFLAITTQMKIPEATGLVSRLRRLR
jgi:hypothetical protein